MTIRNKNTKGRHVDIALLDFYKYLDKVPHSRLLHELHYYVIRDNTTLNVITSCFKNRTKRVLLDGIKLSSAPVKSWIQQGTIMDPLVFFHYVNDVVDGIQSPVELVADCLFNI